MFRLALERGIVTQLFWLKPLVFLACLYPIGKIAYALFLSPFLLGANPAEFIIRYFGDWSLKFLLIGLAITPLRQAFKFNSLLKFRRMLGLFAFFYVCLHLLAYLGFDRLFIWGEILGDIVKRPFILVGFIAFMLLIPLAVTSFRRAVLWMGGKNWAILHKLVYIIALLGVVHYWWISTKDLTWPLIYGVMLGVLLGIRFYNNYVRK